jgi:hypothetical protein
MKNYKFIILSVFFSLVWSGCSEDFLDTKSTKTVDEQVIFSNTKTAMMAVNGLHKLMWTGDLSGSAFYGGYDMLMIYYEVLGDDFFTSYNPAQFKTQATWATHISPTVASNGHFYRLLQYFPSNANMIIHKIDDVPGTQSERDYIKGQAYFYRAFGYFTMVQMYGERYKAEGNNTQPGVVMREDNLSTPKARSTVEEVYTQINEDLDEAIRLLAATSEVRSTKAHINVHVARGLKARVLLTQSKFLEAAKMAELVVNQSGAQLDADTYTNTIERFSNQTNKEWLWGSKPLFEQAKQLTHFHGYVSNENVSYNYNCPRYINNLLYDKISDTDIRKNIWFPQGLDPTVLPRPIIPPNSVKKYANYHSNKFLVATPEVWGEHDIPFMRLPEIMLIVAEGYARAGQNGEAATALYTLAHHRDPQYVKSTKTGTDLIDEIMVQRRVELWGEGFRFFDLKRLNLPVDRGPKPRDGYNQGRWGNDYPIKVSTDNIDPLASNYNMYGDGTSPGEAARYIPAGDKRWQWAIYQDETQLNPLCEPNEY